MHRRVFRSRRTALAAGAAGVALMWLGLYEAYEGRGRPTPKWLRPITWW
jgi:hypothetical protein